MEALTAVLLGFIGGGGIVALIAAIANRHKTRADAREINAKAKQIESKTEQDETVFYRAQGRETAAQVRVLEVEIKGLRDAMKAADAQSEERAGSLYARIGDLATALEKANAALVTANETIAELRLEVKNLNETITKLLVEQAKAK